LPMSFHNACWQYSFYKLVHSVGLSASVSKFFITKYDVFHDAMYPRMCLVTELSTQVAVKTAVKPII
jgi:hypothetical protein